MFETRAHRIVAASTLAVASSGALLALAQPASADPVNAANSFPITVVCGNGVTYSAMSGPGQGRFAPAFDASSSTMLIPLSFGIVTFTITDANGTILDQEVTPASTKGNAANAPNRATQTSCAFFGSQTDPATGNFFIVSGQVVGFVTPVTG
jgi:hypothetical protein